jgi:hypothetical protein
VTSCYEHEKGSKGASSQEGLCSMLIVSQSIYLHLVIRIGLYLYCLIS